ncbi:LamG domain-containing protein, partial [Candidatus Wolfebacteria bacterium]|nr:LamG domain-containing protein [Candidatus Wolfebacteria bacterium]
MIQLENNCGGQNHRRISYQRLISVVISVLSAVISLWLLNFGEAHAALIQKPATNLGLVGYWSMNEGTGSYAGDSSGNKNTGTLVNGPTWVDGKRGKALNFDGVDDYVDAGSNSITGTSPFTLSAWFNARTHTDYGVAVSIGTENANGQAAYIGWVTTAQIGTNNSLGGGWWGTNYGSGITSSGWHHVVMTFAGGSGGATKIYVDNVEKVSTAFTPNLGTQKIQFGLRTVYEFNGLIDEVRIYNRVLSATEIQALYKSGAATVGKTTKIHKDITLN